MLPAEGLLLASCQQNLYDIYHCCVYREKLLMMDRGTVRNMFEFHSMYKFWEIRASSWFYYKKNISFTSLLANATRQMCRKAKRSGLHAVQRVGHFKTMGFIKFYLYSEPRPATARQLILGGDTEQALVGLKSWPCSKAKQRRITCSTQSASDLITSINNAVLPRSYIVGGR